MSNMIATLISIVLVLVLTIASVFYGGDIYTNRKAALTAVTVLTQAQQIHGASLLYYEDHQEWPANVAVLVAGDYLNSIITPPENSFAQSFISPAYADQRNVTANELRTALISMSDAQAVSELAREKLLRARLTDKQRGVLLDLLARAPVEEGPSFDDWEWVNQAKAYIWIKDKISESVCRAINQNAGLDPSVIPEAADPALVSQCYGAGPTAYTFLYLEAAAKGSVQDVCDTLAAAGDACDLDGGGGGTPPPPPEPVYPCTVVSPWDSPLGSVDLNGKDEWGNSFSRYMQGPVTNAEWTVDYDPNAVRYYLGGVPLADVQYYDWGWPYYHIPELPSMPAGRYMLTADLGNGVICGSPINYVSEFFRFDGVSPEGIYPIGGNLMTVTGSGFIPSTTVSVQVPSGSMTLVPSTYVSNTTLTFVAPPSTELGWAQVMLTNGEENSYGNYQYRLDYLELSSVVPNKVYFRGGTVAAILGNDLPLDALVTYQGAAVPIISQNNSSITVTAPAGNPNYWATLEVRNSTHRGDISVQFESIKITGMSPSSGLTAGGYPVTVNGRHFSNDTVLTVGGKSVPITLLSDTSLQFTMPEVSPSAGITVTGQATSIVVSRDSLTASTNFSFTDIPYLTYFHSFQPTECTGASVKSAVGSGFVPTSVVVLDGTPMETTYVNGNVLTFVVPAHATCATTMLPRTGYVQNSGYRTLDGTFQQLPPQMAYALATYAGGQWTFDGTSNTCDTSGPVQVVTVPMYQSWSLNDYAQNYDGLDVRDVNKIQNPMLNTFGDGLNFKACIQVNARGVSSSTSASNGNYFEHMYIAQPGPVSRSEGDAKVVSQVRSLDLFVTSGWTGSGTPMTTRMMLSSVNTSAEYLSVYNMTRIDDWFLSCDPQSWTHNYTTGTFHTGMSKHKQVAIHRNTDYEERSCNSTRWDDRISNMAGIYLPRRGIVSAFAGCPRLNYFPDGADGRLGATSLGVSTGITYASYGNSQPSAWRLIYAKLPLLSAGTCSSVFRLDNNYEYTFGRGQE